MRIENNCNFIGRNTRQIELRFVPNSGMAVARGSIAVDNPFKKEEVMFLEWVAFKKAAEVIAEHSDKGKLIALGGSLKFEQWQDKQGNDRSKHVLVVSSFKILEWKNQNNQQTYQQPVNNHVNNQNTNQQQNYGNDFDSFQAIDGDDDIPF